MPRGRPLEGLLEQLPAHLAAVLRLRSLQGLSCRAAAAQLGVSAQSISRYERRGIAQLRQAVGAGAGRRGPPRPRLAVRRAGPPADCRCPLAGEHRQASLSWPIEQATAGITQVFPSMRTDIVIDRRDQARRLVIDTKFMGVLCRGWYRELSLKTGYVYQLFAYLRSHEGRGDPRADQADGLLLHPAIQGDVDESVQIEGHRMRFATVDLAADHASIRRRLLELLNT